MKLTEFNPGNTISGRGSATNKPTVSFNSKSGQVNFSGKAVELMKLSIGDNIVCHQDGEDPESWYWEKVKGSGFVLRGKSGANLGLVFNSAGLTKAIAGSLEQEILRGKAIIAGEPIKHEKRTLWPMITANLKDRYTYPE